MEHFVPIWISIQLYLLLYSQYKNGQSHVISEITQPHLTYIKIYLNLINLSSLPCCGWLSHGLTMASVRNAETIKPPAEELDVSKRIMSI